MSERAPFEIMIPKAAVADEEIADLRNPSRWPFALAALYLRSGRVIPPEAKAHGAAFGFCDSDGRQQPRAQATHFGWRAGPATTGNNPG